MRLSVVLLNSYFLTLAFMLGVLEEAASCDSKWLRYVYMVACGKRKRQSDGEHTEAFLERLPTDYGRAVMYHKYLSSHVQDFMLDFGADEFQESKMETPFRDYKEFYDHPREKTTERSPSVLLTKLLPKNDNSFSEIEDFQEEWTIDEELEDEMSTKEQREINKLLEECCVVPPIRICNVTNFVNKGCK